MSGTDAFRIPKWVPVALSVQLVLAFFTPPINVGVRHVFLSDLWCVAWLAAALLEPGMVRRQLRFFAASAAVIAVIYLHGWFRPAVLPQLAQERLFYMKETDLFQGARELVVALRFLSWLWAGAVVTDWFRRSPKTDVPPLVARALAGCLAVGGAVMVLEFACPTIRASLGHLYQFNPDYRYWSGRSYGTFRSPIEGGVALALGLVFLPALEMLSPCVRAVAAVLALGGLAASRTHTAIGALALVLLAAVAHRKRERLKRVPRWAYAVLALLVVGAAATAVIDPYWRERLRVTDLIFRTMTWRIYLTNALKRPDLFLLGYGFAPYHTDSSYMFVFTRGGLLGLGLVGAWFVRLARGSGRQWSGFAKSAVLFMLLSGLTLDVFIFRHVVSLWLAVGLPLLVGRTRPINPRA